MHLFPSTGLTVSASNEMLKSSANRPNSRYPSGRPDTIIRRNHSVQGYPPFRSRPESGPLRLSFLSEDARISILVHKDTVFFHIPV